MSREIILKYLEDNGPTFGPDLMTALGFDPGSITVRTAPLLKEGVVTVEKLLRPGGNRLVNCFRLKTVADEETEGQPHVVLTRAEDRPVPRVSDGAAAWANPFKGAAKVPDPVPPVAMAMPQGVVITASSPKFTGKLTHADDKSFGATVSMAGTVAIWNDKGRVELDRAEARRLLRFISQLPAIE